MGAEKRNNLYNSTRDMEPILNGFRFSKGRLVSPILVRVSNVQALAMETWFIAFNKEWTLNNFTT
jgi:hypothetical protein